MKKAIFNWSGGKDASFALYQILQNKNYEISALLTTFNASNNRVSMHGVHRNLIAAQAHQIGLPLHPVLLPADIGMTAYNERMNDKLESYKDQGIRHCIFGDILLEDIKAYRDRRLKRVKMRGVYPIWQQSTLELAQRFIQAGFKAVVVSVNGSQLNRSFAGREYDQAYLADLPEQVDPCGENGEFHTFVYDGPIFEHPVSFEKKDIVTKCYEQEVENDSTRGNDANGDKEVTYYFQNLVKYSG